MQTPPTTLQRREAVAEGLPRTRRTGGDAVFRLVAGVLVLLVMAGMVWFLLDQAWPAMRHYGPFSFLGSSRWAPSEASATGRTPTRTGSCSSSTGRC